MKLLKKTSCYLAGHMEQLTEGEGRGWRNYVQDELKSLGIIFFDPYVKPFINDVSEDEKARQVMKDNLAGGDYDSVAKRMKHVRATDLRICDKVDFYIIKIDPQLASWGTAEELFTANRMKKPIFLIVDGGIKCCPLWLFGTLPYKFFYDDCDSVIKMIKQIDSGEKKIDSDRWRLLKYEYR